MTIRADGSLVWETAELNYLGKDVAISTLQMWDLEEKVMGPLGGISARFPLRDLIVLHKRDGVHLGEHYSTIWVYFFLLEILMLWWTGKILVYVGQRGEEERRASLSIRSCFTISVRLDIMLGM